MKLAPRNIASNGPSASQGNRSRPSPARGGATGRFAEWFPLTAGLVRSSAMLFVMAVALAVPLSFVSVHLALAPLCICLFIWALHIDWPLLNRLAIPPLAVLIFLPTLGMAFGVPMFLLSQDISFSKPHLLMQLAFLLGSPFLFLGYWLGRGKISAGWWPADSRPLLAAVRKQLNVIALFLCAFDVIRMIVGWRSGSLDRGYAGEVVVAQGLGIWTFVGIFNRWSSLWFFFLPYLWRQRGTGMRLVLAAILFFYLLVAFASGSRGLVLIPVIYAGCGAYFFVDHVAIRLERMAPFLVLGAITFIYAVDVFRNTAAFQNTRLVDLPSRLAAVKAIDSAAKEREDFGLTTGRALIGAADDVVYDETPDHVPFAGGKDIIPAILWTWVPQTLAPNKPLLIDGDEIVSSYTNIRQERTSASITLSADLFRRFGWLGVAFGLPVFGAAYGLFIRWLIGSFRSMGPVVGLTLLAFVIGGIQNPPTATVLQTWWIWAYDMPKNLLPLALLIILVLGGLGSGMSRPNPNPGQARAPGDQGQ